MKARPSGTKSATLLVEGPLRFATEHPWSELDVAVGKRVSIQFGMLTLPRGLRPSLTTVEDQPETRDAIEVRLPLWGLAPSVPLLMPCTMLTIAKERSWSTEDTLQHIPEGAYLHAKTSEAFTLFPYPGSTNGWSLRFRGPLEVVTRKGSWVKLRAKWEGGARLQGWARAASFDIQKDDGGPGGTAGGTLGFGTCGRSHRRMPTPYVLKANAPIHTGPKGAIWAHTAGVIQVKAFALSRSDGWLQIAEVDGLPPKACSDHDKIWVHASSVQWTDTPI